MTRFFAAALTVLACLLTSPAPASAERLQLAFLEELTGSSSQPLPPDQAFRLDVRAKDAATLVADFQVAKDHYLYRSKLKFTLKDGNGATLGEISLPAAEVKNDQFFGRTEVYRAPFQALIPVKATGALKQVTVSVNFQGCNEKIGVCYPPIDKTFTVSLLKTAAGGTIDPAGGDGENDRIARLLEGGSFWLVVAGFFGAGLLLALTPCVFPMIPILSGIIVGEGKHVTRSRGLALSGAYVLGMALTYSAAGVAAGLSGAMLSNALQTPWVLGSFAAVFVLLALAMFGVYDLQLPSSLQTRLSDTSNHLKGGKVAAVFLMGALSAIIVGPCVAAPLAGALLYIGQTRNVFLGGTALFAMAVGMGVPLLLVGISAGTLLPRAGAWMQSVKNFFGVLLLAVAIWLVSPVLSPAAHMAAWAALLIFSAIYLHALDPLPPHARGYSRFFKGAGVIALLVGASLLIGVLSGSRDLLQPLAGLRVGAAAAPANAGEGPRFQPVASLAALEAKLQEVRGKPVMLDFYADWCVSCKEFERFTFSDPAVQAKMRQLVLLKADVTANNPDQQALLKKFGLFGPPGILFFNRAGTEASPLRLVGYESADAFARRLDHALSL